MRPVPAPHTSTVQARSKGHWRSWHIQIWKILCLDKLEILRYSDSAGGAARRSDDLQSEYGKAWARPSALTQFYRTPRVPDLPAAPPAGRFVVFSRFFLDRPPGWGVRLVGGVVHSRAVATVARWSDLGRANGEEWAPHAENGLGGNEAALQPAGRQSPRQRVKL